ncbi:hypothetical protein FRC01_001844, partial [Tulasnella sp. 417]
NNEIILALNDQKKPFVPVQDWNKYPELSSFFKDLIHQCWSWRSEQRPSASLVWEQLIALVRA